MKNKFSLILVSALIGTPILAWTIDFTDWLSPAPTQEEVLLPSPISENESSFYLDERDLKNTWGLTSTAPIEMKLKIGEQTLALKGQSSLLFYATPELTKRGLVKVESLNLALFAVPQPLLTGKKTRGREQGILGASVIGTQRSKLFLKYDAANQLVAGSIPVNLHFPQVDELTPEQKRDQDFYVSPSLVANIEVQFKLEKPLDTYLKDEKSQTVLNGQVRMLFRGGAIGDTKIRAVDGLLELRQRPLEIYPLLRFEIARRLCLQPVSIRSSATDTTPTGAGLSFGLPGANTQWKKADVVFQVRAWKSITNAALKVADNSSEETQIRSSVQDDDCIEVFFVENFNPVDTHGGGATWASGTAGSQIISSDGNATGGIDFTHLAHELGHVLALGHPSGSTGLVSGNTGTLMCPSGWHRDNPAINSLGNKENADNPLLSFAIKVRSAGPDCNNNVDCGACPF